MYKQEFVSTYADLCSSQSSCQCAAPQARKSAMVPTIFAVKHIAKSAFKVKPGTRGKASDVPLKVLTVETRV